MTGAELLQQDRRFATGYVFGVVEMQIGLQHPEVKNWRIVRDCMIKSNLDAQGVYDLVESYLRRYPKVLKDSAWIGVYRAVQEKCDPGYKPYSD